ncbi:M15 family metallopeptidase [Leifsonia sp. NPDC102414]|uniref:M15 family metallopeptidase n=1 Tax=Leifsonia sp. NPDC102414 TaxID=3364124 RepID=UPI003821AB0F
MKLGDLRTRRARATAAALLGGALIVVATLSGCATGGATAAEHPRRSGAPHTKPPRQAQSPTPSRPMPTVTPPPLVVGFDKTAQSIDDPASTWVVANKARALRPQEYVPADLVYPEVRYVNRQPMRQEVATALVAMFAAGKAEAGLDFSVQSAYRSYDSQVRVYNDDVARNGQALADTDTSRPGHSEHQTGLAVDISAVPAKCSLAACFAQTPQGEWLAANAWRFGFLLRYPADKVPVTGFTFEPWHFRYIGVPLATQLHTTGVTTLEEFFGVPGGTSYGP